eukprot:2440850-Pyramimonas_sp.AAC.1
MQTALGTPKMKAKEELVDKPHLDGDQLEGALGGFSSGTGLGADQWAPDQLRALSPQCKEELLVIFSMYERKLQWPHQIMQMWHALPPKADKEAAGEERSVGLLPMPLRVWGEMTKATLADWCDRRAGFWGAAVRKSSARQSALPWYELNVEHA